MRGALRRGLIAGAVGTTVLNTVTYLDQALRGRSPSDIPSRVVGAIADGVGHDIPGRGEVRDNRRSALGALSGIATGLGVGAAASAARAVGFRMPAPLEAIATGAVAMAASDVPAVALGVSDPGTWPPTSWVSDVAPHLAYGIATRYMLGRQESQAPPAHALTPLRRPSLGLVVRSALLGAASGGRSSLGLVAPLLTTPAATGRLRPATGRVGSSVGALMLGKELVVDKLPTTISRLEPPALAARLVSGSAGASLLARRERSTTTLPAIFGAAGAVAGSYGGAAWRAWAVDAMPDWQAALIEDSAALLLAAAACLPQRHAL